MQAYELHNMNDTPIAPIGRNVWYYDPIHDNDKVCRRLTESRAKIDSELLGLHISPHWSQMILQGGDICI